eukprot:4088896-Pleurochrysis_carterae.AAC.1
MSALPGTGCRALKRSLQLLWRLPAPWRVELKRAGVRVERDRRLNVTMPTKSSVCGGCTKCRSGSGTATSFLR